MMSPKIINLQDVIFIKKKTIFFKIFLRLLGFMVQLGPTQPSCLDLRVTGATHWVQFSMLS